MPPGRRARAVWSCLSCVASLTSAWYRIGRRAPADRALGYLLAAQDESGALPERAETGASRGPSPAATRELLEAIHAHIAGAFAGQVGDFEDHTRQGDGRLGFLLLEAGPLAGRRVLDAGCGRGCLARALLTAYPSVSLFAVDLSPEMLAHVPAAVPTRRGSVQNLPFEDSDFDVVYCVEALEHAGNPEGAVDELCRVVRPGGRVLIVDKNAERAGALQIEAWESWFDRRQVEAWLSKHCDEVRSVPLVHCPELGPDLFVGWRGTRR
jgi:SAM-dependent methyltransferase